MLRALKRYFFFLALKIFIFVLVFSYSCPTFFPIALLCPVPPTPTVNPPNVCAHESSTCALIVTFKYTKEYL